MLSEEAFQLKLICVSFTRVVVSPAGTLGAVVSGGALVATDIADE
jgi:hypothetical protein